MSKKSTSKMVKKILISQPEPENKRSPYFTIEEKYDVEIDFMPFIEIEGATVKEVRKQRVNLNNFPAVIFTSRNAMDHYFRLCDEMRVTISQETKYFCTSEAIALYLQKHIQYRKRKVFFGNGTMKEFDKLLKKHQKTGKFLLPCISIKDAHIPNFLKANKFDYKEAILYKPVPADLVELIIEEYNMLVFFSPGGIDSLFDNFPYFEQENMVIAAFGKSTLQRAEEKGLKVEIKAPVKEARSMAAAIENYLKKNN